jgi:hypothetical protein
MRRREATKEIGCVSLAESASKSWSLRLRGPAKPLHTPLKAAEARHDVQLSKHFGLGRRDLKPNGKVYTLRGRVELGSKKVVVSKNSLPVH